jgi:hypothetical protein
MQIRIQNPAYGSPRRNLSLFGHPALNTPRSNLCMTASSPPPPSSLTDHLEYKLCLVHGKFARMKIGLHVVKSELSTA